MEDGVMEDEISGTGEVTILEDCLPKGVIDGTYFFRKALIAGLDIKKGTKVEFMASLSSETQQWEVTTIKRYLSPEDIEKRERRRYFTFIGKVEHIYQTHVDVQFGKNHQRDLQKVLRRCLPQDYRIMCGDFLRVKMELTNPDDENSSGKIVSAEPTFRKTLVGQVTSYKNRVCIENFIYFDLSNCVDCRPNVHDYVRVEAIESVQGSIFNWRAISVRRSKFLAYSAPDKESDAWLSEVNCWDEALKDLLCDKLAIKIVPPKCITFSGVRIGSTATKSVEIQNNSNQPVTVKDVVIQGDQSVCRFEVDRSRQEGEGCLLVIEPNRTRSLSITCHPEMLGATREFIVFDFGHCQIGRYLTVNGLSTETAILAELKMKDPGPQRDWQNARSDETISKLVQDRERPIVHGVQPIRPPFFMSSRLENNFVPNYMWKILEKEDEQELLKRHPGVGEELKIQNYLEKFRTALWLEEMENEVLRRQYDMEHVTLRPVGDKFVFDVPGMKDIHPPINIGDRITAFDSTDPKNTKYEAFVYEIRGDSLFAKFGDSFGATYRGNYVTIQFSLGRTNYRRCHHAIELAVRHLGEDWLFPEDEIDCKAPRIPFIEVEETQRETEQTSDDALSIAVQTGLVLNDKAEAANGKAPPTSLNLFRKRPTGTQSQNSRNSPSSPSNPFHERTLDRRSTSIRSPFVSDTQGPSGVTITLKWFNSMLNQQQKDAVRRILRGQCRPLPYIIYGPPGTGKTVTIVEAIMQVYKLDKHSRILVVGPSNSAADVIAEHLVASKQFVQGEFVRLIGFMRQEFQVPESIRDFCVDGDYLDVVARNRLIISTSTTAGQFYQLGLHAGHFSHVFIDEAGYCTEPEALIAASLVALDKSGQVILAGDPKQLGPVLMSDVAEKCGLSLSLLERLMSLPLYSRNEVEFPVEKYNPLVLTKLVKNYRAHPTLLKLPSKLFYDDELEAAAAEDTINLYHSLDFLKEIGTPLLFHGIQGTSCRENDSPSWYNTAEIIQVVDYVRMFRSNGVPNENIGIITPYRKQVEKLRKALELGLLTDEIPKIGSVEEFQGGEREVMIMSLVRSFDENDVNKVAERLSFVFSPKRFNVAVTRAKAVLVVLGNPYVMVVDDIWRTFLKYCIELGCYKGCDAPRELFPTEQDSFTSRWSNWILGGKKGEQPGFGNQETAASHTPSKATVVGTKVTYDSDGEQELNSDGELDFNAEAELD